MTGGHLRRQAGLGRSPDSAGQHLDESAAAGRLVTSTATQADSDVRAGQKVHAGLAPALAGSGALPAVQVPSDSLSSSPWVSPDESW